jgi:small subunit ribosomal protein S16
MVVIRLSPVGAKGEKRYRITVADSRRYVASKYLEILGTYTSKPSGKAQKVVLNLEKTKAWIAKGAQPTKTVKYAIALAEKAAAKA